MLLSDDAYHRGIQNFQKIYVLLEMLQIDLSDESLPLERIVLRKKLDELCDLADLHAEFLQQIRKTKEAEIPA